MRTLLSAYQDLIHEVLKCGFVALYLYSFNWLKVPLASKVLNVCMHALQALARMSQKAGATSSFSDLSGHGHQMETIFKKAGATSSFSDLSGHSHQMETIKKAGATSSLVTCQVTATMVIISNQPKPGRRSFPRVLARV